MKKQVYNFAQIGALFLSFSTLFCCALPAILGALGFGAVVASLLSFFPFLITLSKIREWLFFVTFVLLAVSGAFLFYKKKSSCIISGDNKIESASTACEVVDRWSKVVFWLAVTCFCIAFFMAYLAFPLFKFVGIL